MFEDIFNLKGKIAVVTGAGSGIGRAFSLGLAEFGATVICADRDLPGSNETVQKILQSGGSAKGIEVDVANETQVAEMWEMIEADFNAVDILINNAGIATVAHRTHEFPLDDWDRLMAINLRGVFLCTKGALALMLQGGKGSIINISSVAALKGYYPSFPSIPINYAAAKAGVVGFTRQVAAEYARDQIRVNAIAPGWHSETSLGRERRSSLTADDIAVFEKSLNDRIPQGHRGVPNDLVGLAIYLASDASHYVTGQVIAHDGGWDAMIV